MDGNEPAFPQNKESASDNFVPQGMSIRTWLAGKAMQGLIVGNQAAGAPWGSNNIARESVEYADALIAALNQKGGNA